MTTNIFKELKIGNLIAKVPIIQGGMGIGVSLSGLAAAVANEGGIGIIAAAGGIYTTEDIRRFLQLGASGVQMATRFVTTHECDASLKFKQAYIDAKKEDIVIIKSPVGMPGRAIRSPFTESVSDGKKIPYHCSSHCLKTCDNVNSPYCITWALVSAKKGDFNHGFAFAGANAYRATEIVSVKQLMASLQEPASES